MKRETLREIFKAEDVAVSCPCGKVHLCKEVFHYDRIIVGCGRTYYAIRPVRYQPLKLIPWPGPNLTREEMTGQRSAEQIVRSMR